MCPALADLLHGASVQRIGVLAQWPRISYWVRFLLFSRATMGDNKGTLRRLLGKWMALVDSELSRSTINFLPKPPNRTAMPTGMSDFRIPSRGDPASASRLPPGSRQPPRWARHLAGRLVLRASPEHWVSGFGEKPVLGLAQKGTNRNTSPVLGGGRRPLANSCLHSL